MSVAKEESMKTENEEWKLQISLHLLNIHYTCYCSSLVLGNNTNLETKDIWHQSSFRLYVWLSRNVQI